MPLITIIDDVEIAEGACDTRSAYIPAKQFAERLGVTARRVRELYKGGRLPGAIKTTAHGVLVPMKTKDPRKDVGRPRKD